MILREFNGHLGFIGSQRVDTNGRYIMQLMEEYDFILLNRDRMCAGEITREENSNKSVIDFVLVLS